MFDLVQSSSAATYPWVITKEIYLVQDTRPLYHYPEFKLTTTMYDNWEPQFKPVNQQNLETKTQLSQDDPKTVQTVTTVNNDTAVGVLRMLMNTIIEEGDDSSLAESASYDTHSIEINSIHTLHTKSDGDNKDDDTKRQGNNDTRDNGGVVGGDDDDRSHKSASDSKSVASILIDAAAVTKDDNSIHSRHSSSNNNNNNNNNSGNIHDNENGHDVNDDINHDDDDDDDYSEDH
jgi:hypothetical protein